MKNVFFFIVLIGLFNCDQELKEWETFASGTINFDRWRGQTSNVCILQTYKLLDESQRNFYPGINVYVGGSYDKFTRDEIGGLKIFLTDSLNINKKIIKERFDFPEARLIYFPGRSLRLEHGIKSPMEGIEGSVWISEEGERTYKGEFKFKVKDPRGIDTTVYEINGDFKKALIQNNWFNITISQN